MARRIVDRERLASELANLEHLGPEELRARWLELNGRPAPAGFLTQFLIRRLGCKLQERALGGFKPTVKRQLARIAEDGRPAPGAQSGRPGAVLVREWRGKMHEVHVLDDGFRFAGRRYASLSAVAEDRRGMLV
jgi:hypothetical protein